VFGPERVRSSRLKIGGLGVVQNKGAPAAKDHIRRLNRFDNGGLQVAFILEIHHPLDDWTSVVFRRNALYFEARMPIKVGEGVPGSLFVQARRNPIDVPCGSPIVPGLPVVAEGEGREHLIGSEIGRHPRLCRHHFVRSWR